MIPEGNARPGILSLREAPFQKGMLDAVADPTINRITFMTGAQVGKTLVDLCMIGFFTAHEPRSQVFMLPTETDLRK